VGPIPVSEAACPAFAPDSRFLAVETGEARIRLLDPDTQKEVVVLEDPHQDIVAQLGMAFSHDGTRLVTVSWRATQAIHVWDLRLLRAELAKMGLDWQQKPYTPPRPAAPSPTRFVVDRGRMPLAPQAGLIAYSLAIILQPLNPGAYVERALAYARLGRYPEAVADCDRALALAPTYDRAWFLRGLIHEQLGNRRQALADHGRAIQHQPGVLLYRQARLRVASLLQERPLMRQDSDWLIEHKAATPQILNDRAWELVTGPADQRDPERAVRLARLAVAQEPQTATFLNTLGVALYRNGRYREARATLQKSLAAGRGQSGAFNLFFLAMCHARLGNKARAKECFDRAVKWVAAKKKDLATAQVEELKAFRAEAERVLRNAPAP
jgi:tetratricopeptide (TPR) repeat protein